MNLGHRIFHDLPQDDTPGKRRSGHNRRADDHLKIELPRKLGLGHPETERDTTKIAGDGCHWKGDDGTVSVSMASETSLGLEGPYGVKETYKYFEPAEIAGYPALLADTYDGRSNGQCGLSVGLTDDQLIHVAITIRPNRPNYDRPCDVLKQAAEAAMETIKAAS
ncbi:MAG: DUF3558 domain-containing protein [Thermocrispum sp.]